MLGSRTTSDTDFQPLAGAGRAEVAIFDHPQEKEGQIHVFWVAGEKSTRGRRRRVRRHSRCVYVSAQNAVNRTNAVKSVATSAGTHHSLHQDQTHQISATIANTLRPVSSLSQVEPIASRA